MPGVFIIGIHPPNKVTNKLGIAVGLNKGHKTTAKEVAPKISYRKGALTKRTEFVRSIVSEVAGLAPYERRLIELIRNAGEKRAKKLAKKRLGTHKRALKKVEEMNGVIAASRKH
ncbi:60S ribosomal protein L36 [Kocuria palustris]|nr:60S ribosomal protein L36 [Kocuria palustris]